MPRSRAADALSLPLVVRPSTWSRLVYTEWGRFAPVLAIGVLVPWFLPAPVMVLTAVAWFGAVTLAVCAWRRTSLCLGPDAVHLRRLFRPKAFAWDTIVAIELRGHLPRCNWLRIGFLDGESRRAKVWRWSAPVSDADVSTIVLWLERNRPTVSINPPLRDPLGQFGGFVANFDAWTARQARR